VLACSADSPGERFPKRQNRPTAQHCKRGIYAPSVRLLQKAVRRRRRKARFAGQRSPLLVRDRWDCRFGRLILAKQAFLAPCVQRVITIAGCTLTTRSTRRPNRYALGVPSALRAPARVNSGVRPRMIHLSSRSILLPMICILASCTRPVETDQVRSRSDLENRLKYLAGPSSINCGSYPSALVTTVLSCAKDALSQEAGFWLIEESKGIDDLILVGTAGNADGAVWQITYAEFYNKHANGVLFEKRCRTPRVELSAEPSFICM
jgi:hypothetical protein